MAQVRLGDVAREYKATIKNNADLPIVGLEHLTPGEITLERWDIGTENTFTKGFKTGHMLFGRRRAYLKKAALAPFDGVCSGDITVIEAIPSKINPELLPFIIQNDLLFDYAVVNSAGSLSPRVKWESLKGYEFELPELDKQADLVELLKAAHSTKKAYQKQITATDKLVKSQFIEMFGEEAKQVRLDELCLHFGDGDWIESKNQSEEGIRLIQTGNVGNGEYKDKDDKARYISEETFMKLGCTEVFPGDILISRLPDPIGRACIVPEMPKSITAVDCTIVRLKADVLSTFFVNFTKTPMYTTQIDSFTTGSTRKRISRANLGSVMVPVPDLARQKRFVSIAEQSDKSKFVALREIVSIEKIINYKYNHQIINIIIISGGKTMFTEDVIEKMIIDSLVKNGWEYIPAEELPRNYSDVMVDPMVRDALIRLNPEIAANPSYADEVIIKLRPLFMQAKAADLVTINEEFKSQIFEKNSFPFGENHSFIPVTYFGMGSKEEMAKNRYVVTNQWVYPQVDGGKRLDIVLLINGFPVVIGEIKTATREAISWIDGAEDILDYEKSIPGMFVSNIFNFATEGKRFRYGAINAGITHWGPWHVPECKDEGTLADVQRSLMAMIKHETVLDIFRYFTIFSTDKKFRKIKIVCRYQQYEGANLIVERVKGGKPKKGLIWHFQGSGKSLLMVFAAQKLRMTKELNNATILIVLDRVDLKNQIFATFSAADVPNLVIAENKNDLRDKLTGDIRKIIITTIFLFDQIESALNQRDNIILMVDEAHRTQEGNLGANMRKAIPNAFFFGLTGTPINHLDHNTFATFGATEDVAGYMSKYSFSDSIRDGATLPLNFETVPVELRVDQDTIDDEFDRITEELTEEQKSNLAKRVKTEALIKAPDRVKKVCHHIFEHFKTKVEPNGFKGMVVCYDRESCVLFKEQLDELFGDEYHTAIVMDTNNDKANKYVAYRRSTDEEQKLLDKFRDPKIPLQLLIVTSKLLTGFDAPILQVQYLDKPMKDHTLLQAICRTNRVYGDKPNGLIVDYIGIFEKFARALNFDEESMRRVIKNIEEVKDKIPELVSKCLAYFPGVDRTDSSWEGLAAAQQCLPNDAVRDKFGADYRVLHKIWNIVSPDPCLQQYKFDYKWLSTVYESVRPSDDTGHLIWSALGPKTMELVRENITAVGVKDDIAVIEADATVIEQFINDKEKSKKAAKKIEISIAAIIRGHLDNPEFISLGERLEKLRKQHEQGLLYGAAFLKALLDLAKDTAAAVRKAQAEAPEPPKEEKGKAALTELFNSVKNSSTPIIVERMVNEIDEIVKIVRFPGWKDTPQGRNDVEVALKSVFIKKKLYDTELFEKAYRYVEQYY